MWGYVCQNKRNLPHTEFVLIVATLQTHLRKNFEGKKYFASLDENGPNPKKYVHA